jgi:hypothetical protein
MLRCYDGIAEDEKIITTKPPNVHNILQAVHDMHQTVYGKLSTVQTVGNAVPKDESMMARQHGSQCT